MNRKFNKIYDSPLDDNHAFFSGSAVGFLQGTGYMKEEIWKDVVGYEGLYQVSNMGNVKHFKYGREGLFSLSLDSYGYPVVGLTNDKKRKKTTVHRLVAKAFIPNEENKATVNHINEIKTDNRVENLEWMTNKENSNYGTRNKRISDKMKNGKLSKKVKQISMNNLIVKIWPSAQEAGRNGFSQGCLSSCCRGEVEIHKGFKWEYA